MLHQKEKEAEETPRGRWCNNDRGFSDSWFTACLQETLLPGKPWHKVLERLEAALAEEVKHQISDLKEREMVFHLLGQSFVERHLNECPLQPTSLFPDLNTSRSIGLEDSARAWLQNQCFRAAERVNCQFHFEGDAAELTPEMARFLDDAYHVVAAEMELLLAGSAVRHKERSAQEKETFCEVPQLSLSREPNQTSALVQRSRSIASEDVSLVLPQRPTSQIDGQEKDFQWHIRPELHPPVLSCPESSVLGDMLCDIISQGSENMSIVCERLSGKLLPRTLRQFLWNDKLLRAGSENHGTRGQISVAREAREKFEGTVAQRAAERKLRSAARSPLSGLIENAVVETYRRVPCMRPLASNEQMVLESCKSLNVLYVFNGTYEPYLIYWLFPLQVAFKPIAPRERPYVLAMYLHALHGKLFPSGTEIFVMAESVMKLLEREDPEFFAHLQQAFQKNIAIDPKDFLVELILQEKGSAPGIGTSESEPDLSVTELLLTGPVLFLRKWMWEGFVGVLNLPAVLFIWDQLYLRDWDPEVMRDFCTSILLLLKGPFMAAGDCGAIREVFLSCASRLLTADIRRAWVHLQQGGWPADIPGLNRLNRGPLVDPSPLRHGSAEAGKIHLGSREILPTGVEDIVLTIVLPDPQTEAPHTEPFLENVDPSAVKLTVSVCCGSQKLRSKTSSFGCSLLPKTQERTVPQCGREFAVLFKESFEFDSLDPTAFVDVPDDKPYLLLKVVSSPTGKDPLTLGWQTVDAFRAETTGAKPTWAPEEELSVLVPLNPGEVPDVIAESPSRWLPKEAVDGRSALQLTVFSVAKRKLRLQSSQVRRQRPQGPLFLYPPWVPHDPSITLPAPPRVNQPFDLYIDALHYIPDNATITKVTGHFRNSGSRDLHRVVAFPVLESSSRNPEFRHRAAVSGEISARMDINTRLGFEIHTVDVDSGDLVLLGSCMIHIFNAGGELNVGGFQLKLRASPLQEDSSPLTPPMPVVFGCTLLIRLLPPTEIPVPPPNYWTGYYFTDGAKPNSSELQIIASFQKDNSFPKRVLDMGAKLAQKEQSRVPPDQLETWCMEKLGERGGLLRCIDVHRAVRYRQEAGLHVRIKQAFGLRADGYYVNALARILKGAASRHLPALPHRWGGEEKFLAQQLDFASLQRAPRWTDPSVVLHPYLDDHTVLLVQIYGLDVVYTPDASGQRPGEIAPRSGRTLELNAQSQLGWTALQLFDRGCVRSGVHGAPLFQGAPSAGFLQKISSQPVKEVMAEGLQKKRLKFLATHGSVVAELWDGHYLGHERHELPVQNDLLDIGNRRKFLATQASKRGKAVSQLVLKTLDKKIRKLGCRSLEYRQQEQFYRQAVGKAFYNVVETALLNAGSGPL